MDELEVPNYEPTMRGEQRVLHINDRLGILVERFQDRIAELESRAPANEVQDSERAQYELTIEQQRERLAWLNTAHSEYETVLHDLRGFFGLTDQWGDAQWTELLPRIKAALAPMVVDGKTPGDIARSEYDATYNAQINAGHSHHAACLYAWERAASTTVRAFGHRIAKEALERVQKRFLLMLGNIPRAIVLQQINAELAKLNSERPTQQ